ncbi:MAG: T9SS type A sorting domain-containing protein, partial [Calditrichaeota bacterium]|nr:T9SS type A sorting domain-containing protein [Calditrichota bacterium]
VSGSSPVVIPPNSAILLVLAPAGGTVTYELDRMLIDGVVVDYRSGQPVANYPPRIKSLDAAKLLVVFGEAVDVYCTAVDRDGGSLTYYWTATGGTLQGTGSKVAWVAPSAAGEYAISCRVVDAAGAEDSSSVRLQVVAFINHAPQIRSLEADPRKILLGGTAMLHCSAWDADGDSLNYAWSSSGGQLEAGDSTATWTAPATPGLFVLRCTVSDPHGGQATDSIAVVVQDPTNPGTGIPIAYYPFNGDARDESGFGHHGTVFGAQLSADRFGNANCAYVFDGDDDNIRVRNTQALNFRDQISISLWMNATSIGDRERYPISHGSWDNRWKISLTPEKKVRWTVKTDRGVKDLDTRTEIVPGRFYNVIAIFDGTAMALYLDGALDSRAEWSGRLMPTSIDLTIGQMLPHDAGYNFAGVLDDIRIFSYALCDAEIANIVAEGTAVHGSPAASLPAHFVLLQNYPNPFSTLTTIQYGVPKSTTTMHIRIVDVLGREVAKLASGAVEPGYRKVAWEGNDAQGRPMPSGVYFVVLTAEGERLTRKLLLLR